MRSRTHIVMANALSLAIIRPNNIKELEICIAMATIGGTISDLDVRTSDSHKLVDFLVGISLLFIGALYYIDYKYKFDIFDNIVNSNYIISILGFILFMIICFYGMHKPHRSFLHSILCLICFASILFICFNNVYLPFVIGFISHIILDFFNKRKVKILYPFDIGISFGLCNYDGTLDTIFFIIGSITMILLLFLC